jgi:hypothetical protein
VGHLIQAIQTNQRLVHLVAVELLDRARIRPMPSVLQMRLVNHSNSSNSSLLLGHSANHSKINSNSPREVFLVAAEPLDKSRRLAVAVLLARVGRLDNHSNSNNSNKLVVCLDSRSKRHNPAVHSVEVGLFVYSCACVPSFDDLYLNVRKLQPVHFWTVQSIHDAAYDGVWSLW